MIGILDALSVKHEAMLQICGGQERVRFSEPPHVLEGRHTHYGIGFGLHHPRAINHPRKQCSLCQAKAFGSGRSCVFLGGSIS